ncbi:MAG: peptidoglycan DD-metalloendopeptidase family protein [Actinomycetota bacterium]
MQRFLAFVLVVLALSAGAAVADDTPQERIESARAEREAARADAAERAADLEVLAASEAEVEEALAALQEQVNAQEARVETARAAVAQAEADAAAFRDRFTVTVTEQERLVELARERAVEAYVRPQSGELGSVLGTEDVYEAARREAVLDVVSGRDADVSDQLRSIGIELEELERSSLDAATRADDQRAVLQSALDDLEAARNAEALVLADLQVRIDALTAEIDALEATEAELTSVIARAQAEIEAANRPRPSSSSGGGGGGGSGQLSWPASGTLTSGFGPRWGRMHQGIDIAAPTGTPIAAADGGVVIHSGGLGGYGQTVIIDHGGGIVTLYAHMSERIAGNGQSVSSGALIGRIGSTGNSTGPHLHFEVRVNGAAQNPLNYL